MTFPLPAATSSEKAAVVVAAEQEPPTKEPITSSPPKIVAVSPTLPEEELHIERDLASAMVQSRDSDGSLSPKRTKQIEETAAIVSSSPPQESIQERVQERIIVPPLDPSPPLPKAEASPTVEEHHEEVYRDVKREPQESGFQKPPSSPLLSNQSENQNTSQPLPENLPLLSQYCGGCGDLLTIAPYGIDKTNNTEYRKVLASTYLNNYHIDQAPILQAAQQVQQNLIPTRTTKSKNTKAARKQRKLVAAANTTRELTKGLSKWPDEELRMDMTMIESLLQLKHAPLAAVSCKCWHPDHDPLQMSPGSSSPGSKPSSPRSAKKLKLYNSKQQAIKAKSGASLAKKKMKAVGGLPQEIVSTKTIITKCPKTGKKIKKTVRVVKKLVKKKLSPSQLPAPGLTKQQLGGAIGGSASVKNLSPASKKKALLLQSGATGMASGVSSDLSKKRGREEAGSDEQLQYFEHPKRRRNDEKANPELRDKLMNCPLENGPLYPSQQELMELTTIRKRNALQTFYKRFNELRQFIVIFGDANVPQQFPENHSLGIWVNKMRMERKKWDTGSERTSLTERKIELLESIDFIWAQNHKGEIGWERRFQEIRKFKRKHGHCNVPTKSAENRALGRWVSTQRTMYKNYMKGFVGKSLTREEQERRIFLLLKEGFLFSMIPNGQSPPNTAPDSTAVSGEGGAAAIAASNAAVVSANMKAFLEAKNAAKGKAGVAPATSAAATSAATASPKSESPSSSSSSSSSPTTTPFESPGKTKTNALNPNDGTNATDLPVVSVHSTKSTIAYAAKTESSSTSSSSSSNNPKEDDAATDSPALNKIISKNDGKSETVKKETPPSSNGEVVATPVKDDGDASTPLEKPRASSIALVSVSTTPTTTPSVSTTASPDRSPTRSPEKTTDNSSSDKVIVSQLQSSSSSKHLLSTTEMPIVPSLKPQSTLDAITSQPETSLTTKQSNDDASKSNEIVITAPAVGGNAKESSHTKTDSQVAGSNTESESSTGLAASPAITANDTAFTTSTPPKSSTTLQQSFEANHASYEHAQSQQLVTSNGLKIVVKLTDPSSDNSFSNHNPSPSRRSVRARKPSARQLEAEKTPPILGR